MSRNNVVLYGRGPDGNPVPLSADAQGRLTMGEALQGGTAAFTAETDGGFPAPGTGLSWGAGGTAMAITMPKAGRVVALSMMVASLDGTATIELSHNGAGQGLTYQIESTASAENVSQVLDLTATPLTFAAFDTLDLQGAGVQPTATGVVASVFVVFD